MINTAVKFDSHQKQTSSLIASENKKRSHHQVRKEKVRKINRPQNQTLMQGCACMKRPLPNSNLVPPLPPLLKFAQEHLKAQRAFYLAFVTLSIKVYKRKIEMSEILKLLWAIFWGGVDGKVKRKK